MRGGAALADLLQQIANALALGAIYALLAAGYALIFDAVGTLNLAHTAIVVIAALLTWWLTTAASLSLVIAVPAAVIVAGLLGVAVNRLAFAPLRSRRGGQIRPLIAGLAIAAILQGLARGFFGADVQNYPPSAITSSLLRVGAVTIAWVQLLAPVVIVALLALLRRHMRTTRYGLALRATAENPQVARLLGVNVERTINQTFFLAAACGGAAGILYGLSFNSASVTMADPIALRGLAVLVLGGIDSVPGAVVGGFALALIEGLSVSFLAAPYRDLVAFTVLFLVLALRPAGLLGEDFPRGFVWRR